MRSLAPLKEIEQRYEIINRFGENLTATWTTVLKFILHISRDEQKGRLEERDDLTRLSQRTGGAV